MSSFPRVSVIVPAYNCARYLACALDSILQQDYANFEVVVVNDGSTDATPDVLQRYSGRVRIVTQSNAGPARARNRGVAESSGEFVAFLDGDDVWLPGKLAAQAAYLVANPQVGIVFSRFQFWRADALGNFTSPEEYADYQPGCGIDTEKSGWLYTKILLDSEICIITAMMRKTLFLELAGFDETLRVGEDYDFWLRASYRYQVSKLAANFALYRLHNTNTTSRPYPVNPEYAVLQRALARTGTSDAQGRSTNPMDLRRRFARLSMQHGYVHFRHGDSCLAAEAFRRALSHGDRSPRIFAYALVSSVRCLWRRLLDRAVA